MKSSRLNPGKTLFPLAILLVNLVLIGPRISQAQCHYTYQQIQAPEGWNFVVQDINEPGHLAGLLENAGDFTRVGFWSPETGFYFLPLPPGIINMEVGGLNDHDVICGQMHGSAPPWYGFLWDRQTGQYTTVNLPDGAYRVKMNTINNANQVAGTLYTHTDPTIQAISWYDGAFHRVADDPHVRPADGNANNELGETAGDAGSDDWGGARAYVADFPDLTVFPNPLRGIRNEARCLSNNGFVAGQGDATLWNDPGFGYRGIVWTPDNTYVISPPAGNRDAWIGGINDAGRAVGQTYDRLPNGPRTFAFVWQHGVVTDLNALVPDQLGLVWAARAINNRGQIFAGGASGRYLFTPVWLPGDLTGDCHVSVEDLILVLSNFGLPHGSFPRGDVDGDGAVDLNDLAILLAHWGE